MSFDLKTINEHIKKYKFIARILILKTYGSVPRNEGTSMLVWSGGQLGTIGGGTLEYQATQSAIKILNSDMDSTITKLNLGPDMGQCCGGSVELLIEILDSKKIKLILEDEGFFARPISKNQKTLNVSALFKNYRNKSLPIKSVLKDGWLFEPLTKTKQPIWIYGAGHVGTAIVQILSQLEQFSITCIDTSNDRYPTNFPNNVDKLITAQPAHVVKYAPPKTHHLILTYSHALDLEICNQLLKQNFLSAGLIGSKTKWARFKKRLNELGYTFEQINRIICPIGNPSLGKSPQEIAIGVASMLLTNDKIIKFAKEA
jgi:xanthine dehydrogenase accessory factor